MIAEVLTFEELVDLTGYRQRAAQTRALSRLGVPFRARPLDGFPLVARSAMVSALSGQKIAAGRIERASDEPHFDKVV